jgi:glycine/D-amino acid oxidase-like deaminating enzyme
MQRRGPTLIVVGSGVSGVMTAWQASRAGLRVALYSKSPDPRLVSGTDVLHQSSTFDSASDQRYVTLFEGHPYLELAGYMDQMYPGFADDFCTDVMHGGVLGQPLTKFPERSAAWLNARSQINEELRSGHPGRVRRVRELFDAYTRENRAAMELWYELIADLLRRCPDVLPVLALSYEGILRMYDRHDVFDQARRSHSEHGVLKRQLSPGELARTYPAYLHGVARGLIAGGALEVYGLTFGVQALCRRLLREMVDVEMVFETEIERIVFSREGTVAGIVEKGTGRERFADHYAFHTGAFAGPELYDNVEGARNRISAVEGYWITIANAKHLVQAMRNTPTKIHGKATLASLLGMLGRMAADRYQARLAEIGVSSDRLTAIAPIVDFNNMPVRLPGSVAVGISSGYVYKGLGERDGATGAVVFPDVERAEAFTLIVMELWQEALHGYEMLRYGTEIVRHRRGCKRSWTFDDVELDVNLPTASGGLCMIHDGGNTGSTTKAPFISAYVLQKIATCAGWQQSLAQRCHDLRERMGKTAAQVPPHQWQALTHWLGRAVDMARQSWH